MKILTIPIVCPVNIAAGSELFFGSHNLRRQSGPPVEGERESEYKIKVYLTALSDDNYK